MMKTKFLAPLLMALPGAAFAGGMVEVAPEPQVIEAVSPMPMPNGDWTGVYTGLTFGAGKFNEGGGPGHGKTGIAGLHLGYRYDFGSWVMGGEINTKRDEIGIKSGGDSIKNTTSLQMNVGADMGRYLPYLALGVSRADATVAGVSGTDDGYFGGIGVDYAMTPKWTLGGEVLSSRYANFDGSGLTLKDTSFQVKLGYRF